MAKNKDGGFQGRKKGRGREADSQQNIITRHQSLEWSGPLPNPKDLKAYEDIMEGSADRIIGMAEGFAKHEQEMEKRNVEATLSDRRDGRRWGAFVVAMAFAFAIVALVVGEAEIARQVAVVVVALLASVFVIGKLPNWLRSLFGSAK